jgi:DNA-binding protein Fis
MLDTSVASDKETSKLEAQFKDVGGSEEDDVEVDISYDIIRQVSAQLYTNPRKAIEELVCNSYDAGAGECWIKLPLTAQDPLAVLDNGKSMDLNGVKDLWRIAYSPKAKAGQNQPRIENDRMQIGKFGVGKLATFSLGRRLTHIACTGSDVRLVSVGQSEIREQEKGGRPRFKIFKVSLNVAKPLLDRFLEELPKPWERGWSTWTVAFIEEIEPQAAASGLKIGFFRQMIATALPVSADFKVYLDKQLVPPRVISQSQISSKIDVTNSSVRKRIEEALQAYWQGPLQKEKIEDVPSDYYKLKLAEVENPRKVSQRVEAIIVPHLGPVIGAAIMAKNSLTTAKLAERGYSNNGFFVYVHGKLVNPEDPLFGITQRSHRYWSKFSATVEISGLDKVLLVQRNQVSESPQTQIAREVLRTVFNYLRVREEAKEEEAKEPVDFGKRLRIITPILAPQAVIGLSTGVRTDTEFKELKIDAINVDYATLGEDAPAARFDVQESKILVNEDHPLIAAISDVTKSRALRHVFGEVIAGMQMVKGYLGFRGVEQNIVDGVEEIIEASLRSAASFVRDETAEHIRSIEDASYQGGTPFENAVVTAFRALQVSAKRIGFADEPDGVVVIPMSDKPSLRISIEAKGSKGVVSHKQLPQATVSRQMKQRKCTHAVAIAREFQLKGRGKRESALLRETKRKVTLLRVDAIAHMLELHSQRRFTYDNIAKILTTFKKPDNMIPFIDKVWHELPDLGLLKLVLDQAQEIVEANTENCPDPGMIVEALRRKNRSVKKEDVITLLQAVQIATGMIVILNDKDYRFRVIAPTATILDSLVKEPGQGKKSQA